MTKPDYHRDGVTLYRGDCLDVLAQLPERSVQCCVTSPPYFALRSYLPKGHPDKPLEIGSESSVEAFIATMVDVFGKVRRVLRDDGVLFLNLGDSYVSTPPGNKTKGVSASSTLHGIESDSYRDTLACGHANKRDTSKLAPAGNLLNVPHRVAEALRADGWIWRQTIVWAKRCLSGGTWLYARTQKGDAPAMLKDLTRLSPNTVKLWDGTKWVQVIGWSRTPKGDKRTHLEIELRSGERIGCTEDHRWPTSRGVVYANELRVGDVIETCRLPEPESPEPLCLPDDDLGWLVGFYLAEGCRTNKGVTFSVHAKETAAAERIERLARLVGGTANMQKRHGKAAAIVVYSKTLAAFIHEYITGTNCKNKRLGRKAWMRGDVFLRAVLDGYLEGDGYWDKRGFHTIGFCNNDGMAVDLRCLCARLGLMCRLRRVTHKCNGKTFPGWRGRIRHHSEHWNAKPNGEVVSIQKSRAREFWDVSVDQEPNLFALASGVLSHNSPMPESVAGWRWMKDKTTGKDVLRRGSGRCTTGHEYVFVLAKTNKYFWDSAASAEPCLPDSSKRASYGYNVCKGDDQNHYSEGFQRGPAYIMETRNPRSVWTLSAEPTKVRHFATFPSELVRRCLVAGISAGGCCPTCGAPWAPVVESQRIPTRPGNDNKVDGMANLDPQRHVAVTKTHGYRQTCECPEHGPIGCTVLDPFSGIGTTGQTARELGGRYVGIELHPEYFEVSTTRIFETPRWKLRKSKPKKAVKKHKNQLRLFGE